VAKGWERASFEANTRPVDVERDVSPADFVVPRGGRLVVFALVCIAAGLALAILLVFFPLLLLAFVEVGVGRWILPAVLAIGAVFAVVLYVGELRVLKDFADELRES
jgi:hypothetical protein